MIVDRVDTDIQMGKIDMIEVKTLYARLIVLVIGQGTIQPVNATHSIGLSTEVDKGFSSY